MTLERVGADYYSLTASLGHHTTMPPLTLAYEAILKLAKVKYPYPHC